MKTFQQILVLRFDEAMKAVRAQGWWVGFDYREGGVSLICANHFGFRNRLFEQTYLQREPSLVVYEQWFVSIASLLSQASQGPEANLLAKDILIASGAS
jgi:hypothetical protein